MKAKLILSLALLAAPCAQPMAADDPARTPILLVSQAETPRAREFIFEIREQLRSASALRLETSEALAFHQVRIVAIESGASVVYSVVQTGRASDRNLPVFLSNSVGACGFAALRDCARTVIAQLDSDIMETSDIWKNVIEEVGRNR